MTIQQIQQRIETIEAKLAELTAIDEAELSIDQLTRKDRLRWKLHIARLQAVANEPAGVEVRLDDAGKQVIPATLLSVSGFCAICRGQSGHHLGVDLADVRINRDGEAFAELPSLVFSDTAADHCRADSRALFVTLRAALVRMGIHDLTRALRIVSDAIETDIHIRTQRQGAE